LLKAFFHILLLSMSFPCGGQQSAAIPEPIGRVSDFADVFTTLQANYLDSIIREHEMKTSNEVAVVTIRMDSGMIASMKEFQQYTLELFNKWGIGKKEGNNGVGIIFSPVLKYIRIEVGYGLESRLTDAEAKYILNTIIVPEFKKSAFFDGVAKGLEAVFREISE
jgi:uncharacterized protein